MNTLYQVCNMLTKLTFFGFAAAAGLGFGLALGFGSGLADLDRNIFKKRRTMIFYDLTMDRY